jgi:hypothetical protein
MNRRLLYIFIAIQKMKKKNVKRWISQSFTDFTGCGLVIRDFADCGLV